MALIAPTAVTLTVELKPNQELASQTTDLVRLSAAVTVTSPQSSLDASAFLSRIQHLRRWIAGIYTDAKKPLTTAKRTLDAQEKALLEPLADAERRVMRLIVDYTATQKALTDARHAQAVDAHLSGDGGDLVVTVAAPTVITGMQSRTTYGAEVQDLRALVLAVAGTILLSEPGSTKVTQSWIARVCRPTRQATLHLLEPSAPALHALARALKSDLDVPGVSVREVTTLVAR
ncbi:MAG: hypothetical protein O3A25_19210 [Acidobacteria bacterium]|nr:hypothetical protein [Acidobacteriota bacterium]